MGLIGNFKNHLINLPGWRTNRKIVVIQSDDWGSIRMPSLNIREKLDRHPLIKADDTYCYNDTLASAEDLEALFEVLNSVKDKNGNPAVITANCVMANPDFEAIKENKLQTYEYETLDKTFERYHNEKALNLWKEGMNAGMFAPQFHGREHVNVPFWMHFLKGNHTGVKFAFEHGVFGVNFSGLNLRKDNFQAGWDFESESQEKKICNIIEEGLNLFKNRFGYRSLTAIPPSYTWSDNQERILLLNGIRSLQTISLQKKPKPKSSKYRRHFRYTKRSLSGRMGYIQRNVFFEPITRGQSDVIKNALERIEIAFKMYKPAVIGSHRLNFIGSLCKDNRTNNLRLLKTLLEKIREKWPEVEFLSTVQLSKMLTESN